MRPVAGGGSVRLVADDGSVQHFSQQILARTYIIINMRKTDMTIPPIVLPVVDVDSLSLEEYLSLYLVNLIKLSYIQPKVIFSLS